MILGSICFSTKQPTVPQHAIFESTWNDSNGGVLGWGFDIGGGSSRVARRRNVVRWRWRIRNANGSHPGGPSGEHAAQHLRAGRRMDQAGPGPRSEPGLGTSNRPPPAQKIFAYFLTRRESYFVRTLAMAKWGSLFN